MLAKSYWAVKVHYEPSGNAVVGERSLIPNSIRSVLIDVTFPACPNKCSFLSRRIFINSKNAIRKFTYSRDPPDIHTFPYRNELLVICKLVIARSDFATKQSTSIGIARPSFAVCPSARKDRISIFLFPDFRRIPLFDAGLSLIA